MNRRRGGFGLAALLVVAVFAAVVAFWPRGAPDPAAAQPQTTYTLTLTQPGSGGTLDHYPKRAAYAAYERVVIRARVQGGYKVWSWGGDCAHVAASTGWCMLTMDADKTVSASFVLRGTTPTPTPTITVQAAHTLALATAANGALTANPEQATYDEGATVVVTATPKAGYQLAAWGGDCAGTSASSATCTLTMDADKTARGIFEPVAASGPPNLLAISDGSHDAMILEWSGGPANATKWQYRTRTWEKGTPSAWTSWTDIPGSGASTRSYRLTGLTAGGAYDFEVRAVAGAVPGDPSVNGWPGPWDFPARGTTQERNTPRVYPYEIVEGDGRTRWRVHYLDFTIIIPDGVRLAGGVAFVSAPCHEPTAVPGAQPTPIPGCPGGGGGTSLIDVATGSELTFSDDGVEWNRTILEPAGASSAQQSSVADRVNALFDTIMDSLEAPP